MYIAPKIILNAVRVNFRNQIKIISSVSKTHISLRSIHYSGNLFAKMYMENENQYAYDIMESKGYAISLKIKPYKEVLPDEQFKKILEENWSEELPKRLFDVFSKLGTYCTDRKLCISNKMFDDFIDKLTDNIQSASDKELEGLFYSLLRWPETESTRTRNYIEVWAALDDECLKRIRGWSFDETLNFIALFFMLNVSKYSDFTHKAINKLASKAKQLTPGQLVQTMFYVGVLRRQPFDMHNLELRAISCFDELSIDDLAIISMGFFKSKTPIRSMEFVSRIADKIIVNAKNIHEVSLAALLKVIRYSMKIAKDDTVYKLLDALQHEVPRLSVMCIVHLALLGTSTLTFHKDCLTQIAMKVEDSLKDSRMKDLERIVLTYGTFLYKPKMNDCLFEKILDELKNPERQTEIEKHSRSFACCVSFFPLLELYPVDLMDKILSPDFLENTYGKYCYLYGREILNIHNTSLIFCGEAQMHRLTPKEAKILAKKYTAYIPNENYKKQYNVTEKMMLDVLHILREDRGGDDYVVGEHILTHHQRGDIIICNSPDGLPLPVKDKINLSNFGLVRTPPDDNHWIVLVIAGRNALIQKTDTPTGFYQHKIRELKALGYHAVLVTWTTFQGLQNKEERCNYLRTLIKEAMKYSVILFYLGGILFDRKKY